MEGEGLVLNDGETSDVEDETEIVVEMLLGIRKIAECAKGPFRSYFGLKKFEFATWPLMNSV